MRMVPEEESRNYLQCPELGGHLSTTENGLPALDAGLPWYKGWILTEEILSQSSAMKDLGSRFRLSQSMR